MRGRFTLFGVCLLLFPTLCLADDWPFIAGPNFNFHAVNETLHEQWPEAGPAVLWDRKLGQGYSSFAVVGKYCVTQYQSAFGQFVLCLHAATGQTLWEHRYDHAYEALGLYPGPRSTPTIAMNSVYFVSPDGQLGCLDLETGKQKWVIPFYKDYGGAGADFGYAASPLVINDLVVLPNGGPEASVIAFNREDGALVWKSGRDSASYCPTIPISFEGETLLLNYLENAFTIHDLKGNQRFRLPLSSGYDEHAAMPLYAHPLLILSAPFKAGATAYQLKNEASLADAATESKLTMTNVWHSPLFSNDVMTSVIIDDMILGFDLKDPQSKVHRSSRGMFRALDRATGKVLWNHEELGQANTIYADNRLLLFNDRGEVFLAEFDRNGCRIVSKAKVFHDQVCWTRPVLADGRLFVRSHDHAVCLAVGTQQELVAVAKTENVRSVEDLQMRPKVSFAWLLAGEREHPLMPMEVGELLRWFLSGMGIVLLPWLLLWTVFPFRSKVDSQSYLLEICLFAATITGLIATPLLNSRGESFYFLWPASLFAAFQATAIFSDAVSVYPHDVRRHRIARISGVAFFLLVFAYFMSLRQLGEPMLWIFLLGLLTAWPLVGWTAISLRKRQHRAMIMFKTLAGFTLMFWTAAGVQAARTHWLLLM